MTSLSWEEYDENEAILRGVEATLKPKYEVQRSKLNSVKDQYARHYYASLGKFGGLIDTLSEEQRKELSNAYKDAYRKYLEDQSNNEPTGTPITDAYHRGE